MRILLVVPQDEEIGGVASVVGNLARYLTSRGHQVFFFHPAVGVRLERKTNRLGFPGFYLRLQMPFGKRRPAVSLLAFLFFFPVAMCQLIDFIHKHKIQVINVHYPADFFLYFAIARRIFSLRLVTSIHGADVFLGGKPEAQYSPAIKFLLSSTDLIVAPSKRFQQDFLTVFPAFDAKTVVIHNGINLAEFDAPYRKRPNETQAPYLLCISAYKEQKAIDVLIRAFKMVLEEHPSLRLVLVGAGPLRASLEHLAVSLEIQERIDLLGPKTRSEVASLLRRCKVFVLPSRFETFGIVILEAMACNKPVIATTAGGIPEIIEDGKNGILVPPDDAKALANALIAIMNDRNLRMAIASNGHKTVHEQFGSEKNGAAYEALFSSLIKPLRAA